jgi:PAS domain S-box-containing protein
MTSLSQFASAAVQTLTNLTAIEAGARQLSDARTRLEAALEAGAIATGTWDIPNDRVLADTNLARLFSVSPADAQGGPLSSYVKAIHPEDVGRISRIIGEAIADGTTYDEEYRVIQADGSVRWVVARGKVERDQGGRALSFSGAVVDVTERKQAEAERERLVEQLREADVRKDEFLAMLAHELRNPLAAISNGIQLVDKVKKPEILAEIRGMIQHQITHLTRLIDDLLDVSRISQGKIVLKNETVLLADAVCRAVQLVRPLIDQKRHRLTVSLPDRPAHFVADPTRTEQILGNLLTNAAKYTEAEGAIHLSAAVENDEIVFRIRDTGVGISAEMLPLVFSLFTQVDASLHRSQGGLGIGLTLVRTLVEMHGGSVTAASRGKGHGSEFTVRMPIGEPGSDISDAAAQDSSPPSPGVGRILVVDDNRDTANTTAILLSHRGYQVQTAHTGPDALEVARQTRPHLILLDIGLPGMSGYEVASRLRDDERCKDAVLIAVSGYADDKARERSQTAGFQQHLIKPINFGELYQLIDSLSTRVSDDA